MWKYLGRRLLTSFSVLIGVSIFTFLMLHLVPGDPVHALLGRQAVSPERLEELREELGFNDPLPVQYFNYINNVIHGDLGRSLKNNRPVFESVMEQFPSTLELTLAALLVSSLFGIIIGAIGAAVHNTWVDKVLSILTISGISIPPFFFGLLLILFFSVRLNWLPATANSDDPQGLILPALTLAVGEACWLARLVRSSILEELDKSYQWTARSKGANERTVLWHHVLRNSLIPIVTAISIQFVYLMAGSVVVESIFARQGIGRLAVTAIQNRDFPLVQGTVSFIALIYVLINSITDLIYAVVDPRVRLR